MTPDRHLTLPADPGSSVSRTAGHVLPARHLDPPAQKDVALRLYAVGEGARLARHLVRSVMATWPAPCDTDTAVTVTGELFANACAATPGRPVWIRVSWHQDGALVSCWDSNPACPAEPSLPADLLNETGRGMYLIHTLSLAHGITPETRDSITGKSVWSLVPTRRSS